MRIRYFTAVAGMLALGACANEPELVPTGASGLPSPTMTASGNAAGVRLDVNTDAWRGVPADLGDKFTPVLVTISNDGNMPLRVRYGDFILKAPAGEEYHALPPFNVKGTVSEPLTEPTTYRGFLIAPYLSPFYPRLSAYTDPFLFDEIYFSRYYPAFVNIQMPTGDMIQKALPEGVLEPGGRVSGFLYFEDPEDEVGRVTLTHTLMTTSGDNIGSIQIPFETR